jgi:hypothetical protein
MASGMGAAGTRVGDIDEYAKATGGPVLSTGTKEAADRLTLLIDQIRARYTLGYKPTRVQPQGKFCKLSLQLSPELLGEHPELRKSMVLTKSGYYR